MLSNSLEAMINGGPIDIKSSKGKTVKNWRKNPELRSMNAMLHSLNNKDLMAYMTRISRPKRMRVHPVPCSKSYLNPNVVPNTHILDTEKQIRAKQRQVQHYEYIGQYLLNDRKKAKLRQALNGTREEEEEDEEIKPGNKASNRESLKKQKAARLM